MEEDNLKPITVVCHPDSYESVKLKFSKYLMAQILVTENPTLGKNQIAVIDVSLRDEVDTMDFSVVSNIPASLKMPECTLKDAFIPTATIEEQIKKGHKLQRQQINYRSKALSKQKILKRK